MRIRGFATTQLMGALAILGVLAALAITAYNMGRSSKQAEWDRQKLADIAAGQARDQDISDQVKEQHDRLALAKGRAEANDRKWMEARRETARTRAALGACPQSAPAENVPAHGLAGEPAGSGLVPDRGAARDPGIRLLWRFVGLHDGAFTGLDGEPLFADSARYAGEPARADTHSPYGLDDAIDVGADNARALSTCRREYFSAREKLKAAEAAWGRGRR